MASIPATAIIDGDPFVEHSHVDDCFSAGARAMRGRRKNADAYGGRAKGNCGDGLRNREKGRRRKRPDKNRPCWIFWTYTLRRNQQAWRRLDRFQTWAR